MDFDRKINSKDKVTQIVSRWSNGNVHFVIEYDDNGIWKDGNVLTFYMDSAIKSNHYYKNSTIEGEALDFENNNLDISSASKKEFINFLNE